jgi:hypothetical protein
MNPPPDTTRALLATARVANIPSVVSNVWLGIAMGLVLARFDIDWRGVGGVHLLDAGILVLSGLSLYVSGNFLNDWKDRDWDALHRPERALPSGLFKPGTYLRAAVVAAMMGLGLALCVSWRSGVVSLGIIACILIYTTWHKQKAWSVVFMGLCRGLLPVLGASGMIRPGSLVPTLQLAGCGGCALCCYIAGLSLSARSESHGVCAQETRLLSRILLVLPVLLMLLPFALSERHSWLLFIAPLTYFGWLVLCLGRFGKPVSRHVSALLAGIPLVDWIFLLPVFVAPLNWQTPPFQLDFLSVASAVIPPLAFVSALLLQRLAPAT